MAGRPTVKAFAPGTRFGEHARRDWHSIGAALATVSGEVYVGEGTQAKGARGAPRKAARLARERAVAILRNVSMAPVTAFASGAVKDHWRLDVSLAHEADRPPYRILRCFLALDPDPAEPARLWAAVLEGALVWSDLGEFRRAGVDVAPFLLLLKPFVSRLPRPATGLDAIPAMPRECTPTADDLRHGLDESGLVLERDVSEAADGDPAHYEAKLRRILSDWRERSNGGSDPSAALAIMRHPSTYLDSARARLYQRAYTTVVRTAKVRA